MNNFTKSYIREADCREIQGLRSVFEAHDWYCQPSCFNIPYTLSHGAMIDKEVRGKDYIWLPTGDQLDEEIVKIVEKIDYIDYPDYWCGKVTRVRDGVVSKYWQCYVDNFDYERFREFKDINPLIAKIRLLKQLIKER